MVTYDHVVIFSAQQKIPGLSTREELLMSDAKPKHPVRDKKQIAKRYSEEYKEAIVTLVSKPPATTCSL